MYKAFHIEQKVKINNIYTLFSDIREANYSFEGERHNFWEMVCVLEGNVGVACENELYTLTEGQAVFHSPMEFHNIWSENSENTVFIFSFSGIMPKLESKVYDLGPREMVLISEIINTYKNVFKCEDICITNINQGMETEAEKIIKLLEILILSTLGNSSSEIMDVNSKSAQNYLNIVSLLNENIHINLTVEEIAQMCNMSPSNLKKTFNKYSGVGIINYFNSLKIEKAQKLLKKGYSVKETAYALGFSDQNYFSVVFKRIAGISPLKYKNKK